MWKLPLEQIAILCSHLSFLRKQESRPPARWMPDHVRHDGSRTARAERETLQECGHYPIEKYRWQIRATLHNPVLFGNQGER